MKKKKTKQLYHKLFWTYIVISFVIIASLTFYYLSSLAREGVNEGRATGQKVCIQASDVVEAHLESANYLFNELYRGNQELSDIIAFLEMEPDKYQEYSLDQYSASNNIQYRGMQLWLTGAFEAYSNLDKIELISLKEENVSIFLPQDNVYPYKNGSNRLVEIQNSQYYEKDKVQFAKVITNPENLQQVGVLVFTFSLEKDIAKLVEEQGDTNIIILQNNKTIVCISEEIDKWSDLTQSDIENMSTSQYCYYKEQKDSCQIYSVVDLKKAAKIPLPTFFAVVGVGLFVYCLSVLTINIYVRHLTNRVDRILHGMDEVTTGNWEIRLKADFNGDELDMISENFNEMCRKLDQYIQKSYMAEIEKKNAELQALQSQINPHFLYNTLEAIRMKAICNGDREVGKMLYSMSVLFRSQLKDADWITIGQELDYCKQYLELFEYRFNGIFTYSINCPLELLEKRVIKFILQPIIENYFIHGIRRERTDNVLAVTVSARDGEIIFNIMDNGNGMSLTAIEKKNIELQENQYRQTQSVGIDNVNRRIKAVYGNSFGIVLKAADTGGLIVMVRVGMESRYDTCNDCRG